MARGLPKGNNLFTQFSCTRHQSYQQNPVTQIILHVNHFIVSTFMAKMNVYRRKQKLGPPPKGEVSDVENDTTSELSRDQGSTAEEGQPELRWELLAVLREVKVSGEGNLNARRHPTCQGRKLDKDLLRPS